MIIKPDDAAEATLEVQILPGLVDINKPWTFVEYSGVVEGKIFVCGKNIEVIKLTTTADNLNNPSWGH